MDEIYKINYLKNNEIEKIVVFTGNKKINYNLLFNTVINNEIQINDIKELNIIFSNDEITNIINNKIKVRFVSSIIHNDDNIDTIKKKIYLESENEYSTQEFYIYAINKKKLKITNIYNELSSNGNK